MLRALTLKVNKNTFLVRSTKNKNISFFGIVYVHMHAAYLRDLRDLLLRDFFDLRVF